MSVSIQSVSFWLNAFLPRHIPAATTTLRAGQYAGLTAISDSLCCLTDQRGYSSDPRAKSRMQSAVIVDCNDSTPRMTQWHKCDYTTECNCQTGEVRCHKKASTVRMKCELLAVEPNVVVQIDCLSTNPCAPPSRAFGDIAYKGTIVVDVEARSIAVDLMSSQFPAFEAYAAINDGAGSILFRYSPTVGYAKMRLPAGARRSIRSRLEDRNGDGIFELPGDQGS